MTNPWTSSSSSTSNQPHRPRRPNPRHCRPARSGPRPPRRRRRRHRTKDSSPSRAPIRHRPLSTTVRTGPKVSVPASTLAACAHGGRDRPVLVARREGPRETDCWLWAGGGTAAIADDGYGRFWVARDGRQRVLRPHRVAWALAEGVSIDLPLAVFLASAQGSRRRRHAPLLPLGRRRSQCVCLGRWLSAALVPQSQGCARGQVELRQDPADVVLDGALRQGEVPRDRPILRQQPGLGRRSPETSGVSILWADRG